METKIDVKKGFRFVFEDPEWVKKILIGGLLYITVIGIFPVSGWGLEVQRRVIDGEEELLPDWSNLGTLFKDGFKAWIMYMLYGLPILIFTFGLLIVSVVFAESEAIETSATVFSGFLCLMPFTTIYSFGLYGIHPLISGLFIENKSIRDAFNFRRIVALFKTNWIELVMASLLGYAASYVISLAGMLLCGIGIFLLSPAAMAIVYFFFGQAYRNSVLKLEHEQQTTAA